MKRREITTKRIEELAKKHKVQLCNYTFKGDNGKLEGMLPLDLIAYDELVGELKRRPNFVADMSEAGLAGMLLFYVEVCIEGVNNNELIRIGQSFYTAFNAASIGCSELRIRRPQNNTRLDYEFWRLGVRAGSPGADLPRYTKDLMKKGKIPIIYPKQKTLPFPPSK